MTEESTGNWPQLHKLGFPGGSGGKESTYNAGDLGLIPGLGRSPGGREWQSLQYSCLENPVDRETCGSIIYVFLKHFTVCISHVRRIYGKNRVGADHSKTDRGWDAGDGTLWSDNKIIWLLHSSPIKYMDTVKQMPLHTHQSGNHFQHLFWQLHQDFALMGTVGVAEARKLVTTWLKTTL